MRFVTNAWTSVATDSSSSERRTRRSWRSWKKHLALTEVTCLSRHRSGVMSTPRTLTVSTTSIVSFPSLSFSAVLALSKITQTSAQLYRLTGPSNVACLKLFNHNRGLQKQRRVVFERTAYSLVGLWFSELLCKRTAKFLHKLHAHCG